MKITKLLLSILLFSFFSSIVFSQERIVTNHSLRFILNEDSQSQDIIINVLDENSIININVRGRIKSGKLNLEVYDPTGKRLRNVSLNSEDISNEFIEYITKETKISLSDNESIIGQTRVTDNSPIPGEWIIKIIPEKSIGQIDIQASKNSSSQFIHRIDL